MTPVCALGGEDIVGVVLNSPVHGGTACVEHVLQALSVAAFTPAGDPDFQDVTAGPRGTARAVPTPGGRAGTSPPRSPAGEATHDSSLGANDAEAA